MNQPTTAELDAMNRSPARPSVDLWSNWRFQTNLRVQQCYDMFIAQEDPSLEFTCNVQGHSLGEQTLATPTTFRAVHGLFTNPHLSSRWVDALNESDSTSSDWGRDLDPDAFPIVLPNRIDDETLASKLDPQVSFRIEGSGPKPWLFTEGVICSWIEAVLSEPVGTNIPFETLDALKAMVELPDNWDGNGALAIPEETVKKAIKILDEAYHLPPGSLPDPSVAPAFGRMIVAEWTGPNGNELILDIPSGDKPPTVLLVERDEQGNEEETDREIGNYWSIREVVVRLLGG